MQEVDIWLEDWWHYEENLLVENSDVNGVVLNVKACHIGCTV